MFNLPTQPMTLGDAINNTFKLWWATLVSVLPLSVAAGVLNGLPLLEKQWVETHTAIFITTFVIIALINLIPTTAILAKIGHAIHDQTITSSQALAISLVKYPKVLAFVCIFGAVFFVVGGILHLIFSNAGLFLISFLFFFLLFLIIAVYFLCVLPIIIFENLSLLDSIRKSYDLTKNQWWYGGWLLTVVVIINSTINLMATYLLGSLGSLIVYCFTLPLQSSMIIVFYEHLKSRAASQNIISPPL